MISKEEMENNINTEWNIPLVTQSKSRYGICKYILETCESMNLSQSTASLAMLMTNYFFIKNCYFNYDKISLACSALLLSCKTKSSQSRIREICERYNNIKGKNSLLETPHKVQQHIGKYELYLLKSLDYNIPDEFPYDFINIYSEILYPNNDQEIANLSSKIANDSFFTLANNIYKNYIVALSCIFIAAKFLDIPTILEENFKFLDNMKRVNKRKMTVEEFNKELYQYDNNYWISKNEKNDKMEIEDNDTDIYFEKLNLCEKLYPTMKMEDLLGCIKMITSFYEDMAKEENDDGKKKN